MYTYTYSSFIKELSMNHSESTSIFSDAITAGGLLGSGETPSVRFGDLTLLTFFSVSRGGSVLLALKTGKNSATVLNGCYPFEDFKLRPGKDRLVIPYSYELFLGGLFSLNEPCLPRVTLTEYSLIQGTSEAPEFTSLTVRSSLHPPTRVSDTGKQVEYACSLFKNLKRRALFAFERKGGLLPDAEIFIKTGKSTAACVGNLSGKKVSIPRNSRVRVFDARFHLMPASTAASVHDVLSQPADTVDCARLAMLESIRRTDLELYEKSALALSQDNAKK